jgi:hypothetical protein
MRNVFPEKGIRFDGQGESDLVTLSAAIANSSAFPAVGQLQRKYHD